MRLFIAIQFDPHIKSALREVISGLKTSCVSGNFSRPENLHLTLAFIGESDSVSDLRSAMERVCISPFELELEGSGNFGPVFWVGIKKNPKLSQLATQLSESLEKSGFQLEKRPFRPHITIARKLELSEPLSLSIPSVGMKVDSFSLMKSERINGKLTYTEIYRKVLKA